MNKLLSIIFILLLVSCNVENHRQAEGVSQMEPVPLTVTLNTEDGYTLNTLTGDSINAIINLLGDTIITGKPIPVPGKSINPENTERPETINLPEPKARPIKSNIIKIPETYSIHKIEKDKLATFIYGVDTSSHILVNSTGDTITTGIPIPVKGKVVPALITTPVQASQPVFLDQVQRNLKHLDVDQGLNSSSIMSVYQDSRGYLWFGSMGGGVSRYNGHNFTYFTENQGLSGNTILCMIEDRYGNMWFGTEGGGICKYDGEYFTQFSENEGLGHNKVNAITEDQFGNLWIGTYGGGATYYDGENFTHFTEKEGLCSDFIWSIMVDSDNNVWFGSWGAGISMYDGHKFTQFTKKDGLSENHISAILEDNRGNIWFGTFDGGLIKYNGDSLTIFTVEQGLSNNVITSLIEDDFGNIWIGFLGGGINIYDGQCFIHHLDNEEYGDIFVSSIQKGANGSAWIGTWGNGVYSFINNSFTNYTEDEGLNSNNTWAIKEDRQGNLWVGTFRKGLNLYAGGSFLNIIEFNEKDKKDIWSFLEDNTGCMWIGTNKGLLKYPDVYSEKSPMSIEHFTDASGLSNDVITSMEEDRYGNIWLGTELGGLNKYDGKRFMHFTVKEGLNCNNITFVLEDKAGNIWIGTKGGGISKYDGHTFTHFTEKEGLSSNNIQTLFESRSGDLWIGTENRGISIFNGELFTHITEREGLSSNNIAAIIEDSSGNIWISTDRGLDLLVFESDSVTFKIHSYDKKDGLAGIAFVQSGVALDHKNRIWWGTGKSLTMLDLNSFVVPVNPPTIQLERVEINDQFYDFRNMVAESGVEFEGVSIHNNYPVDLEVGFTSNHLTFYFAGIDWAAPHKVKYSFKIEGLVDNWSMPTSETYAEYRNLPYGKYTFKVRAIGEAQIWSEPFEYKFIIRPPWWHTWWARSVYVIFIFLLIFTYVRWRIANLKQRQKELVNEIRIATREIREQKDEIEAQKKVAESATQAKSQFLANMSHEIRTPMNAIIGLINLALKTELNNKQTDYLEKVDRSAYALLGIINDILDFSKIEAGKIEIEKIPFDLEEVFENVANLNAAKAQAKGLEFSIHISNNVPFYLIGDPLRIGQIITNYCSNATKFTETGDVVVNVELDKKLEDGSLLLNFSVKDTGIGLTKEQQSKMFKEFSQADSTTTRKFGGTGLGLAINKKLAEMMGGTTWLSSEFGKGSTFYFSAVFEPQEKNKRSQFKAPDELSSLKILACDDNATARFILKEAIETFGFEIDLMKSGKECITALQKESYDLIIVDWLMPEMDGLETIERIKDTPSSVDIPIIMVSAFGNEEVFNKSKEMGVNHFISKPYTYSTLFDCIMELFGKDIQTSRTRISKGKKHRKALERISGATILLAEDNEINQQVASELLKDEGFMVEFANNGQEALDMTLASGTPSRYNLIFMDIQMPVMDGYTAAKEIRRHSEYDELPIVSMTADAMLGVKEKCLELGMNDMVTKPIDLDEMFGALVKWIKPETVDPADAEAVAGRQRPKAIPSQPAYRQRQEADIPIITGLDTKSALLRMNNKKKLYFSILESFYNNNQNFIIEIKATLKKQDYETAARLVHTLKGVSGNIGADSVHENTKLVEASIHKKDIGKIEEGLNELNKILIDLFGNISDQLDLGSKKVSRDLNVTLVKEIIDRLKSRLKAKSPKAKALIKELAEAGLSGSSFDELKYKLNNYDFKNALITLENIEKNLNKE